MMLIGQPLELRVVLADHDRYGRVPGQVLDRTAHLLDVGFPELLRDVVGELLGLRVMPVLVHDDAHGERRARVGDRAELVTDLLDVVPERLGEARDPGLAGILGGAVEHRNLDLRRRRDVLAVALAVLVLAQQTEACRRDADPDHHRRQGDQPQVLGRGKPLAEVAREPARPSLPARSDALAERGTALLLTPLLDACPGGERRLGLGRRGLRPLRGAARPVAQPLYLAALLEVEQREDAEAQERGQPEKCADPLDQLHGGRTLVTNGIGPTGADQPSNSTAEPSRRSVTSSITRSASPVSSPEITSRSRRSTVCSTHRGSSGRPRTARTILLAWVGSDRSSTLKSSSLSFSPGRGPMISIAMSRSGSYPARRIMLRARSMIRTGSPISSTKTSPGAPARSPARITSWTDSGIVM